MPYIIRPPVPPLPTSVRVTGGPQNILCDPKVSASLGWSPQCSLYICTVYPRSLDTILYNLGQDFYIQYQMSVYTLVYSELNIFFLLLDTNLLICIFSQATLSVSVLFGANL